MDPKTASRRAPSAARPDRLRRHVRLVADVGLGLLPPLLVELLTGLVLFAFGHRLTPTDEAWAGQVFLFLAAHHLLVLQDISFQTDLHVWAGYLSIWAIALKAYVSWPTLRGWWPRGYSPTRRSLEKALAWVVLVSGPLSYVTGLGLLLRHVPFGSANLREIHLWVSAAFSLSLGWHLIRFLPLGLRVLVVQVRQLGSSRAHSRSVRGAMAR
jgi:hypothetical protein